MKVFGINWVIVNYTENFTFPHVHSLSETVQPHFALSMHKEDFQKTIKHLINFGIKFIEDIKEFSGGADSIITLLCLNE